MKISNQTRCLNLGSSKFIELFHSSQSNTQQNGFNNSTVFITHSILINQISFDIFWVHPSLSRKLLKYYVGTTDLVRSTCSQFFILHWSRSFFTISDTYTMRKKLCGIKKQHILLKWNYFYCIMLVVLIKTRISFS